MFYQHQYLHNNAAVFDEYFELVDAYEKFNSNIKDRYKSMLLVFEESIDILHFATEYCLLFLEHSVLCDDTRQTTFPTDIFNNNDFKELVISESDKMIEHWQFNNINLAKEEDIPFLRMIRNIIRNTAWKDWRKYAQNYYTTALFDQLFDKSFKLVYGCYEEIYKFAGANKDLFLTYLKEVFPSYDFDDVSKDYDYNIFINTFSMYFMYGCYVSKNWVNMQRQIEDPRYTGKDFGDIIGVEV
jgi:hypothetical protein